MAGYSSPTACLYSFSLSRLWNTVDSKGSFHTLFIIASIIWVKRDALMVFNFLAFTIYDRAFCQWSRLVWLSLTPRLYCYTFTWKVVGARGNAFWKWDGRAWKGRAINRAVKICSSFFASLLPGLIERNGGLLPYEKPSWPWYWDGGRNIPNVFAATCCNFGMGRLIIEHHGACHAELIGRELNEIRLG